MLEKIAEMVREEAFDCGSSMPCFACNRNEDCNLVESQNHCPDLEKPDGSLMLARWAVLLVARGLETLPDAKEQDLRQLKSGKKLEDRDKTEQAEYVCAMSNLGIDFMNLLTDATISAREAKEGSCTKE